MEQDSRNHRVAEFGIVPDVEELSNLTGMRGCKSLLMHSMIGRALNRKEVPKSKSSCLSDTVHTATWRVRARQSIVLNVYELCVLPLIPRSLRVHLDGC